MENCSPSQAALALTLAAGDSALADGLFNELKFGVLDHDVPDLWSNFRAEPASVALNVEALLSPALALWGGIMRPALGASITARAKPATSISTRAGNMNSTTASSSASASAALFTTASSN